MNPLKKFAILLSVCLDVCGRTIIYEALKAAVMIPLTLGILCWFMYYLVTPSYIRLIEFGYCSTMLGPGHIINYYAEKNPKLFNETILTLPVAKKISILRQYDLIDWNFHHEIALYLTLLLIVMIVTNLCGSFLACSFAREGYNLKDRHIVMIYVVISFALWFSGFFLIEIIIIPPFIIIPVGSSITTLYYFLHQPVIFYRNVRDKYNEQISKTIV